MNLDDAKVMIIVLVVVGVTGAVGLLILSQLTTVGGFTGASLGAINNVTLAISGFFGLLPTVGIVFGAVVILGAVALIGYTAYQKFR